MGTQGGCFAIRVLELQKDFRRLQQYIENLDDTLAAEATEEAKKSSWSAWLLSAVLKRVEDGEEKKELKARPRRERMIEKDLKMRRLEATFSDLSKQQNILNEAQQVENAAFDVFESQMMMIQESLWFRDEEVKREQRILDALERQERERYKFLNR